MSAKPLRSLLVLFGFLGFLGFSPPMLHAPASLAAPGTVNATFVVDTTSDAYLSACTAAANDCSLRGAINNANFDAGLDTITFSVSGTITLGSMLPTIDDDVTIVILQKRKGVG